MLFRSEKVARDIETAKKQAITLAKDIQDQEYSLTVLETRLKDLEATAAEQTTALSRRDAQMRKIPYMLVVGDKEIEANAASVRLRTGENLGPLALSEVVARLVSESDARS